MNVLLIGDIVAKAGRSMVVDHLPSLIQQYSLDFVVANAENVAHGFGVTSDTARELFRCGVDVLTSGNHIWDKKEILEFIRDEPRLLRPANFSPVVPGNGFIIADSRSGARVGVLNLQGRIFMGPSDDPFSIGMSIVNRISKETPIIIVDMHGEATSEKQAMGWYLDGKVSAVFGTHTHVPTADHRVLPEGTAYVTDVGMTGAYDSVIGIDKDQIIQRFLDSMPTKFEPAKGNPILHAMLVNIDPSSGKAQSIERIVIRGEL